MPITDLFSDPFGDEPAGLEDMVVLGNAFFRVAVPADSSPDFKRYVVAAAQTCALMNRSVDNVLRTHRQDAIVRASIDPSMDLVRQALRESKRETRAAFDVMHHVYKPAHAGITISWAAMYRMQATVPSICFTTVSGFHFESAALQRLMLEQLAWVAAIRNITDERYMAVDPQRCLSSLKRLFPLSGPLYGNLSAKAHITPDHTRAYIESDSTGRLTAKFEQREWCAHDACSLLILSDIYSVLAELLVADLLDAPTAIKKVANHWVPKPSRPFLKKVSRLTDQLLRAKPNSALSN